MRAKEMIRTSLLVLGSAVTILLAATFCSEPLVTWFTFFPQQGMQANLSAYDAPIESIDLKTQDGVRISAFFVAQPKTQRTVLFLHGNAGNASHRLDHAVSLWQMKSNVLLVDYRGYGLSDGEPSEPGIYQDGEAGLRHLTEQLGIPLKKIFVLGRSLGSAVAVHIAQNRKLAGVILVSPLSSGNDVARRQGLGWLTPFIGQPFDSLSKVGALAAPLLIIHGENDDILPLKMGQRLFDRARVKKDFVRIPNAGHNDLIASNPTLFYSAVRRFMDPVCPP